jgi:hypothetical protein
LFTTTKKTKTSHFSFIDNGIGILESIKLKGWYKFFNFAGFVNNADVLKEILHGKVGSRTGNLHRGKGLPTIYKQCEIGEIQNLVIITNDVYANVSNNDFQMMPYKFQGTFLYWEIKATGTTN